MARCGTGRLFDNSKIIILLLLGVEGLTGSIPTGHSLNLRALYLTDQLARELADDDRVLEVALHPLYLLKLRGLLFL